MSYFLVDPNSVLTWSHDWTEWLESLGSSPTETIAEHSWSITPLNEGSPTTPVLSNANTAIVTARGFEVGKIYHLVEHIITETGLEDDRYITLRCEQR